MEVELMKDTKKRVSKLANSNRVAPQLTTKQIDIRKKMMNKIKMLENAGIKSAMPQIEDKSKTDKKTSTKSEPRLTFKSDKNVDASKTKNTDSTKHSVKNKTGIGTSNARQASSNLSNIEKSKSYTGTKLKNSEQKPTGSTQTGAGSSTKDQPKVKKPFRRPVNNAPPISFADLLKLADANKNKVTSTKVTEDILSEDVRPSDTRLLTQEEKERQAKVNSKEYKEWLKSGMKTKFEYDKSNSKVLTDSKNTTSMVGSTKDSRLTLIKGTIDKKNNHGEKFKVIDNATSSSHSKTTSYSNTGSVGDNIKKTSGATSSHAGSNKQYATGKLSGNVSESMETESQNPWDRIYGKMHPKKQVKRKSTHVVSDSDNDCDSDELSDDFICDDPIEETDDVSHHIREIFNYDKRRYWNETEGDDRSMETNFREQMREEAVSSKIGKMEDLEDMQKEMAEIRAKKSRKKLKK